MPSTVPASSGAVRRLVLVNSSNRARSTVPELDLTILDSESDVASANSAPSPHTSREPGSDTSAFDPQPEVVLEFATDSLGGESDTESLAGSELVEEVLVERPLNFVQQPQITAAFRDLDEVNLTTIFECRAHVMKTVPFFLTGGFKRACSSLWKK